MEVPTPLALPRRLGPWRRRWSRRCANRVPTPLALPRRLGRGLAAWALWHFGFQHLWRFRAASDFFGGGFFVQWLREVPTPLALPRRLGPIPSVSKQAASPVPTPLALPRRLGPTCPMAPAVMTPFQHLWRFRAASDPPSEPLRLQAGMTGGFQHLWRFRAASDSVSFVQSWVSSWTVPTPLALPRRLGPRDKHCSGRRKRRRVPTPLALPRRLGPQTRTRTRTPTRFQHLWRFRAASDSRSLWA